jgi:hypothetical protein
MKKSPATIFLGVIVALALLATGYKLLERVSAKPAPQQAGQATVLGGHTAVTDTSKDHPGNARPAARGN